MKSTFFILGLFFVLFGCSDEKEKETELTGTAITVSDELLVFMNTGDAVGNKSSVTVESSGDWRLSGKKAWCRPSVTEGKSGETVVFEADPNSSMNSRSTTFTFISGDQVAKLIVTQSQDDVIDIYNDDFEVDRTGGEITVRVNASSNIEYEIAEDCKAWVSLLPKPIQETRGGGTLLFDFRINENETYRNRIGHVVLHSANGTSKDVTIQQERRTDLKPDKTVYEIPVNGGALTIRVSTNLAYRVVIPESAKSWLTYDAPSDEMEEPEDISVFEERFTIGEQGEMTRSGRIELQSLDGTLKTAIILKQRGSNPQMIEIADEHFRKCLADNYYVLNESEGIACELTDLGANLTTLDVSGQKIHSLEGVKFFANLRSLVCRTNYLKTIDLDGTKISAIDLDENPLEIIKCGSAPILNVNVSYSSYANNKGLIDPDGIRSTTLTVSGDNVEMVQLVSNPNVGYLNIVNCLECTFFAVSGCKVGMKVYISRDYKGSIPSWGLPTGTVIIRE